MVAVRSSLHLDVPIATEGRLLVDTQYLSFLTDLANRKFEENAKRIATLCQVASNPPPHLHTLVPVLTSIFSTNPPIQRFHSMHNAPQI